MSGMGAFEPADPDLPFGLVELDELPKSPRIKKDTVPTYTRKLEAILASGSSKWVELGRYRADPTARLVANMFRDGIYPLPVDTSWEFETRRYWVEEPDEENGVAGKKGSILYVRNTTGQDE